MDASGYVASLLLLTVVVGRGRHTMLSDRGTVLYSWRDAYIMKAAPLFWGGGDSSQTTPTVSFFSSLDCLGGSLESSAFTSPLLKLKKENPKKII